MIPIQDTGSYTGAFTQYFDLYNNKSYFSSTASLAAAIPTDPKLRDGKAFNEAKYLAYKLSGNDLDALISKISKPLFDKLYGHAITEVKDNKILEIDDIGAETDTLRTLETNQVKDSSIVDIVSKIPADYFEGYYVLDYFPGSTNHGKKVLDVISERFAQYGLDTIGKRIIPVPINYFQNQPLGLALLKRYYQINSSSYTDPDFENIPGMGLVLALEKLNESKYADCEKCIPQGFLNVIFKHY